MNKEYYKDAYRVAEEIKELLRKNGIEFIPLKREPGVLFNRIEDNGGLAIICECNGLPTCVCTPLGEINFVRRKSGFFHCSEAATNAFFEEMTEKFGLVPLEGRKACGETFKRFAITRLYWKEETLPVAVLSEEVQGEFGYRYVSEPAPNARDKAKKVFYEVGGYKMNEYE